MNFNPLKDSMRQVLEQMPSNSEHVKSVFKSLLLVHVANIKDQEDRSTWQSFINTLENYSTPEDLATYSFGPSTNSEFASNFKETLNQVNPDKHYSRILKVKSIHVWRIFLDIQRERNKALKCVMLISLRLKYVESFWRWQMFSGGLEKIAHEFYVKKTCNKIIYAWRLAIRDRELKFGKYCRADRYWTQRTMLTVMINWTGMLRDMYANKRSYSNSRAMTRKLEYEKVDLRDKSPMPAKYQKKLQEVREAYNRSLHTVVSEGDDEEDYHLLIKKANAFRKTKILGKSLHVWKQTMIYSVFSKKICGLIKKNLERTGFKFIRLWAIKGFSMKQSNRRHSIDHLSDYELSVKISIMERKLSSLHSQLLSEQITNSSLLSEKEELIKIFNY